jgi:AcrR family transcriptional regulator
MYHFPSKDELIRGVLEYFSQQCEVMLMRRVIDDPEPRMRWARCMLDCLFPQSPVASQPDGFDSEVLSRFFIATLAGAVTSPGAMQPLIDLATRMRNRCLSDPRDGMEQLMVWLTIDGLLLWQFMALLREEQDVVDFACSWCLYWSAAVLAVGFITSMFRLKASLQRLHWNH